MLVDANVLIYAVDSESPHHAPAAEWLRGALDGARRVALPWQSIGTFLRITTHPRIVGTPMTIAQSWRWIEQWLTEPMCWSPDAGLATARILGRLLTTYDISGNAIPDAQLAALAIEHGIPVVSADSDFARFPEVRWINPLRPN